MVVELKPPAPSPRARASFSSASPRRHRPVGEEALRGGRRPPDLRRGPAARREAGDGWASARARSNSAAGARLAFRGHLAEELDRRRQAAAGEGGGSSRSGPARIFTSASAFRPPPAAGSASSFPWTAVALPVAGFLRSARRESSAATRRGLASPRRRSRRWRSSLTRVEARSGGSSERARLRTRARMSERIARKRGVPTCATVAVIVSSAARAFR